MVPSNLRASMVLPIWLFLSLVCLKPHVSAEDLSRQPRSTNEEATTIDVLGIIQRPFQCWSNRCRFLINRQIRRIQGGMCEDFCVFAPARYIRQQTAMSLESDDAVWECGACDEAPASSIRFQTELEMSEVTTPEYEAIFTDAAARWEEVIVGDIPDYQITDAIRNNTVCPNVPDVVDDVFVCISTADLDGPSNVVLQAQAEFGREETFLPITAVMMFDAADIPTLQTVGSFNNTVLHQFGRVYGISDFLWTLKGLTNKGSGTCSYAEMTAVDAEWTDVSGGCTQPFPLDGDDCNHWDNLCVPSELMTDSFLTTTESKLSQFTVATLEDLGYSVSYDAADRITYDELDNECKITNCNGRRQRDLRASSQRRQSLRALQAEPRRRRMLDDDAAPDTPSRQAALDYGRKHLAMMRDNKPPPDQIARGGSHVFLADQIVFLVYQDEEDGKMHNLVVTSSDMID